MENISEAVDNGARLFKACGIVGITVRTLERWRKQPEGGEDRRHGPKGKPGNSLKEEQRENVVDVLTSKEYRNQSPKQIVPTLADLGIYLASESTMYRILREEKLDAHRAASRPPRFNKPREHVATGPGQVLSWDITYVKSPIRGMFYYLYLVVDVWSRNIMGWDIHDRESTDLAAELMSEIFDVHCLSKNTVVLHMDNGSPMKGSTLCATMQALGILPSFSRPHVSDDNAFSESLFRTLKYRPEYPTKPFKSLEAAHAWVAAFVDWYNHEHKHSAIGFVTPDQRHSGEDAAVLAKRCKVYEAARRKHPERWSRGTRQWDSPQEVYLNPKDPANHVTANGTSRRKEPAA